MVIKSLKIKNQSYYYWNDIIFIDDFDIKYFKITKRQSRIGIDIYYIGYVVNKLGYDLNVFNTIQEYIENKIILDKIDGFDKIRFSSDIDLPLDTLIQFKTMTIIIRGIIKKDDKYYPEIYLDECLSDRAWSNI